MMQLNITYDVNI